MAVGNVIATFPSDKFDGSDYEIREARDGSVYCTCMAWRFSKSKPKDCKHLARIRNVFSSSSARSDFTKTFLGGG